MKVRCFESIMEYQIIVKMRWIITKEIYKCVEKDSWVKKCFCERISGSLIEYSVNAGK